MSIINDTLKQLEKSGRQGTIPASFGADQVVQPKPEPKRSKAWFGLLLVPLLLWLWWPTLQGLLSHDKAQSRTLQDAPELTGSPVAETSPVAVVTVPAEPIMPQSDVTIVATNEPKPAAKLEPTADSMPAPQPVVAEPQAAKPVEFDQNVEPQAKPIQSQLEPSVVAKTELPSQQERRVTPQPESKPAPNNTPKVAQNPASQSQLEVKRSALSPDELAQQLWQQAQTDVDPQPLLSQALQLQPDLHAARLALAPMLRRSEGEAMLQQAVADYPQFVGYPVALAERALADGQTDLAQQWLRYSAALPAELAQLAPRALMAQQLGLYQQAAIDWQALLQSEPNNANGWLSLGYNLEFLQRADSARQAYQRALQLPGLDTAAFDYAKERLQQLGDAN